MHFFQDVQTSIIGLFIMRLVCALVAFFIASLVMCRVGSLSETSFFTTLGAALHATVTFGIATTAMLLIADIATIAEVPQYRQLALFTAYFVGLLAVAAILAGMSFRVGYKLPDRSLQNLIEYQFALPILAAWAAYGTTLWCHPSR